MPDSKYSKLIELIALHNKPELAKLPGMVRQVWQDGEITCQKSGSLLWQRNLHMFESGFKTSVPVELFPKENYNEHGNNTYIFTDEEGSLAVRQAIRDLQD